MEGTKQTELQDFVWKVQNRQNSKTCMAGTK